MDDWRFQVLLQKGGPLPFLYIDHERRRREAEEDRTSKHRLTGQGELSTKPHWQLGCFLAPLLLSRLRAQNHREKRGKIYKVGPVTRG